MTATAISQREFDICYARHGGNTESRLAFERVRDSITKTCCEVYDAVSNMDDIGLTSKEYSRLSGKPLNAVSGRFTELVSMGHIKRNGERRDGCAVYVAA